VSVCRRPLVASLVLALLLVAGRPAVSVESPYDIYVIAGITGPGAFVAHGVQTSLGALERYVNATGGIKGQSIHFVILDDQTNPATTVQMVNQVIAKRVPVFIGPVGAATCAAAQPLLANGPVAYCLSNSVHPPAGSYMFSAQLSTKDFSMAGLRYLMAKGVKKVALLTSTDATGQDGEQIAIENLKSAQLHDLQVVDNEHFNGGDISVTAQIARIKGSGAQAIYVWTTGPPLGTVLRGIQEAGWNGIVMTHGGNINKNQMESYAAFLPDTMIFAGPPYMATTGEPARVRQAKAIFLEQMHQAGVDFPDLTQMLGWDPSLIVIDALRHLGTSASAAQIHDYIEKLHDFAGVNGIYDFRRGDQRGLDPTTSVVVRWDRTGDKFLAISKPGGAPL
jgi:branched-chain amino acid transport system substrate-binding protein